MSVQVRGYSTNIAEVEASRAARVAMGPDFIGAVATGGRYRAHLRTNLATVISAITATGDVGQIGQFRWGSAAKKCLIDRIEIGFQPVTDFTTFQRIVLGVRKVGFAAVGTHTATASGGTTTANLATVAVLTGDNFKRGSVNMPTTVLTDFRLTDTADLTCGAGARSLDVQDFMTLVACPKSDGATIAKPRFEKIWEANGRPLVLHQDTGLSLMNHILWGAAGTAVVDMAVEWREILNAELPAGY